MIEKQAIMDGLTEVFRNEFDDSTLIIHDETTAKDIDDWDSLAHIQLIISIEKHFKIRFKSSEILKFKNVGDMAEIIKQKIELNT